MTNPEEVRPTEPERGRAKLTRFQASEIEDELRTLEADPKTTVTAMRLFMQAPMPCGHATGNLLTCSEPPYGCVVCGDAISVARDADATPPSAPATGCPYFGWAWCETHGAFHIPNPDDVKCASCGHPQDFHGLTLNTSGLTSVGRCDWGWDCDCNGFSHEFIPPSPAPSAPDLSEFDRLLSNYVSAYVSDDFPQSSEDKAFTALRSWVATALTRSQR